MSLMGIMHTTISTR